jgi:hypothetical protein
MGKKIKLLCTSSDITSEASEWLAEGKHDKLTQQFLDIHCSRRFIRLELCNLFSRIATNGEQIGGDDGKT